MYHNAGDDDDESVFVWPSSPSSPKLYIDYHLHKKQGFTGSSPDSHMVSGPRDCEPPRDGAAIRWMMGI